jgi:hypothetical protein
MRYPVLSTPDTLAHLIYTPPMIQMRLQKFREGEKLTYSHTANTIPYTVLAKTAKS